MQGSLLPSALLSKDFGFIAANKALCDLLQLSMAQLRRRTVFDVVDERDREGLQSFLGLVARMRTEAVSQREVHLAAGRNGERRSALLVIQRTGRAAATRYRISLVDLTDLATGGQERAALLEQIEQAAWEWRRTFDAVEMPIVIVGPELAVARMNRAARMLVGKSYGEIIGTSLRDFPTTEPWVSIADLASRVQEARAPAARQVKDSSGRTLDLLAILFSAEDTADDRVIVIVWDVSALVDLQSRLEQQRQMAAMGALVAGVAHEVRNPLFAISATVDAMEQTAGPELREYFDVLREEIDRMTALMQDLLAYGRPAVPVFSDVGVREVAEMAARACSALASKHRVEVQVDAPAGLTVVADRERLSRAIENVVINAIQHAPADSTVVVACRAARVKKSSFARIFVRDRGRGFPVEDLPRVFEPFFSRRKGGTGLGLALVQQIVTEHGGEIHAANADGGGAEVMISIPARTSNAS
ncbi:MAG TPA: ATP-binding protein [Thermoanaerobaculia bacterium]|nr:ATP-binding protein [Thermoanaerobaculia bacterium]